MSASVVHELKIKPSYFYAVKSGRKGFELRRNDRNFQQGDVLHLRMWQDGVLLGPVIYAEIAYVQSADPFIGGLEPDYVILGLESVGAVQV